MHADAHEFVLHFDVDVIDGFQATNLPNVGGLRLDEVREALEVFAAEKHLAAIEVTGYNPLNDRDGSEATLVIDLLAGMLTGRLNRSKDSGAEPVPAAAAAEPTAPSAETAPVAVPPVTPGEGWSSDMLEANASEEGSSVESPEAPGLGDPEERH